MSAVADFPMQVSLVPGTSVHEIWEDIAGYMDQACEESGGRYLAADVLHLVSNLGYQLWIAFDGTGIKGTVVTGFVQYPRKKCLDLMFMGGTEGREWKTPMLDMLKKWAVDNDCEALEGIGRVGWERVFKEDGGKRRFLGPAIHRRHRQEKGDENRSPDPIPRE